MRHQAPHHTQARTIAAVRIAALIGLTILAAATAKGQTRATMDENGNFTAVQVGQQAAKHDSTTTSTFTWPDGRQEPVYIGAKGSYYLARTSKKGNYYRKYIKTEE